jgi:hypothetical protein
MALALPSKSATPTDKPILLKTGTSNVCGDIETILSVKPAAELVTPN